MNNSVGFSMFTAAITTIWFQALFIIPKRSPIPTSSHSPFPSPPASGNHRPTFCQCCFCSSVTKLCPALCSSMDCRLPGSLILHCLMEFAQIHIHWVGDLSNHLIFCLPFLLLPSIFSSIRVFSIELALPIRWPKYWSFSFTISPFNEYSRSLVYLPIWTLPINGIIYLCVIPTVCL